MWRGRPARTFVMRESMARVKKARCPFSTARQTSNASGFSNPEFQGT